MLHGKVIIVTGSAHGVGAVMAPYFAGEGAAVLGVDIDVAAARAVADEVCGNGGSMAAMQADVTEPDQVKRVFSFALDRFGKVDAVVNNAGVVDNLSPVGDVSDEMWHKVFDVDVNGSMYMSREAIKNFLPQGSGVIINIASAACFGGGHSGVAYTAAKHALVGMTKNTAFMYGNDGIRTNAIASGPVDAGMARDGTTDTDEFGARRIAAGLKLMPKIGPADSIAKTAAFLISDDAKFINGAVIPVDGGWSAY